MNIKKRIGKTSFGVLLLTIVAVVLVSQTSALPEYSSELQKIYGNGSCTTCHTDPNGGDGGLTGYGTKFARQFNHVEYPAAALKAVGEPPVNVPIKMSEYLLALQGVYGNGSCTTCHIKPSGNELTEYGKKFSAQLDHVNDPIAALRVIGVPGETVNVTTAEKAKKKSPGFEIVVTIGMISAIYILRKSRIK